MLTPAPTILPVKRAKRRAINAILRAAYRKFAKDKVSRRAVKSVLIAS
jgi:hypothetical protein